MAAAPPPRRSFSDLALGHRPCSSLSRSSRLVLPQIGQLPGLLHRPLLLCSSGGCSKPFLLLALSFTDYEPENPSQGYLLELVPLAAPSPRGSSMHQEGGCGHGWELLQALLLQ